jgi:hypothetical protein
MFMPSAVGSGEAKCSFGRLRLAFANFNLI